LLVAVYKNMALPLEQRLAAAQTAIRFEKPALSVVDSRIEDKREYVARMPQPEPTPEAWMAQYGSLKGPRGDGELGPLTTTPSR
jgi:type II secretory pathway component PulM